MIPRIFEGKTVFVVAGGPSLRGFNFRRLDGRNVIAINRGYEVLPEAQVLWWSDARFWRHHRMGLITHNARWKATGDVGYVDSDILPAWVVRYHFTGHAGLDPEPTNLRTGNNSSFAAIHLAAHIGARRIVLLGVDMRHGPAGETHFHEGHGVLHLEETMTKLMIPYFESLAGPLAERGIEVINASPDSALAIWPRVTIDEGLGL